MTNSEQYATMWNDSFRIGAYDLLLPINFDRSIAATFDALAPGPNDHILDVGCGTGRTLLHARDWLRAGGRWTGFDIADGGLEFASRRGASLGVESRIKLVCGDMRSIASLLPGGYDGVMVHFAVFTMAAEADRRATIAQIARVLRPGGRLAITVPSETYRARRLISHARALESTRDDISSLSRWFRQWILYSFMEIATRRQIETKFDSGVFHRYTQSEIEEHLAAAGFQNIVVQRLQGVESYRAVANRGD
jgi:ubiquinone/menaquinone biosynthesis C-methylase UbiE